MRSGEFFGDGVEVTGSAGNVVFWVIGVDYGKTLQILVGKRHHLVLCSSVSKAKNLDELGLRSLTFGIYLGGSREIATLSYLNWFP